MPRIITFAGPSLPATPDATWKPLLKQVQIRAPAQDGDILAAARDKPQTIVLLDGYYFDGYDYTVPVVKQQELLLVLEAGIQIIGGASMGALYASELNQCGIVGVGQVFEWFRDGILQGSDEIVVLHLPQEFDYQLITVALVEVRYALQQLVRNQVLSSTDAQSLIQAIKKLPFTERRLELILQLTRNHLNEAMSELLRLVLLSNSIKQADAKLALQLACSS